MAGQFFINGPIYDGSDILVISWSDHAPITISLAFSLGSLRICHWHLNKFLLKHVPSKTEMENTPKLYFAENISPNVSLTSLWESHKMVFRGQCISISIALKLNSRASHQLLMDNSSSWRCNCCPPHAVNSEGNSTRAGLRDIELSEVEEALLRLLQTYYDKANKLHTLLARQLFERLTATSLTQR